MSGKNRVSMVAGRPQLGRQAARAAPFAGRGHEAGRAATKTVQNGPNIAAKRSANNPKNEGAAAIGSRKNAGTGSQTASATRLPTRENHAGAG